MTHKPWHDWVVRGGIAACALLLLKLTAGCAANSQMTNLWHDASLPAGSMHAALVVALRKDPVRRRAWEDAFSRELGARGVTATSSYRLFPSAPPDTQEVIDAVREHKFDAVLTSVRLPDEATSTYVEGTVRQQQVPSQQTYDYSRFHSYWVTVQDPGYTETDTIIRIQTDVWATSAGHGHLIWSGTLRTLESTTGKTAAKAVSNDIMPEMQRQGLVARKGR